jgi:hypothetical protein
VVHNKRRKKTHLPFLLFAAFEITRLRKEHTLDLMSSNEGHKTSENFIMSAPIEEPHSISPPGSITFVSREEPISALNVIIRE